MASKFQNRLVGTVVLVALAVIVLPGLLDGQKKHYQDEFAAIPLVPKAGDKDENDLLPPASQPIPAQPPEGAAEEVRASNASNSSIDTANLPANTGAGLDAIPVERDSSASGRNTQAVTRQPGAGKTTAQQPVSQPVTQPKVPVKEDTPPTPEGKAYVVQLGALKNADKVNEIVSKLRASGYRVYTLPTTPVQGKITRILVGPEASKDKLKASLGDLHSLSGLNGVVMNYSVH
ncbi:cell division protein DedD [Mangrovibacter plantisponsor]|uniref:Cell division protein DedD n=1 Tax=Mangrovibacter plantisponsor TaxID=451513 RepID=A0A317Q0W0_9ENTR|nr:cell division protein DedD [Mangrovibacter plantisponsor]PWW09560.1 DedD protein [Mangrovibacter plantisponsor]